MKQVFGQRVQKLSVHTGLNCPNRDGTIGTGGCSYCSNEAFTPSYCQPDKTVKRQLEEGIEFHKKRYRRASLYIAYLQAFSNTYVTVDRLQNIIDEALSVGGVCGISIGTRPDCLSDGIVDLLSNYAHQTHIKIELGIESVYDKTLQRINRGHTMSETMLALKMLHDRKLHVGGHLILGLPGESRQELMESAQIVSKLNLNSIKLHQLQIFKNTVFEKEYKRNPEEFHLFDLSEYVDFIVDFTAHLSPELYIERFAGEVPPRYLIAPDWGMIRYDQVLHLIRQKFVEKDTFQGKYFSL